MRDQFVFETPQRRRRQTYDQHGHTCECQNRRALVRSQSSLGEIYQPQSYDRALQHFSGPEHQMAGDLGLGKIPTTIVYDERGTALTFGEIIALAGDHFGDYFQMKELSRTAKGRQELRYALWKAMDGKGAEPNVPKEIRDKVKEDYLALAGRNISHYSHGGTSWNTYFKWHSMAMVQALDSGIDSNEKLWREALSKEGFALHFLTDSFSSGHVRTPRAEMDAWYAKNFSHAGKKFADKFASFMYDELKKRNRELKFASVLPLLNLLPKYFAQKGARADMRKELTKFSLDDPIALALHNIDNENGLPVISLLDPNGKPVKGGFKWFAFGDDKIETLSPSSKQPDTKRMVVAAVKASVNELRLVRAAGAKNKGKKFSQSQRVQIMKKAVGVTSALWNKTAAAGYVPKEDKTRSTPALEWRWGKLDPQIYARVDKDVRTRFARSFYEKATNEKDVKTVLKVVKIGGVKDALNAFGKMMEKKGIAFLEELVGKAR